MLDDALLTAALTPFASASGAPLIAKIASQINIWIVDYAEVLPGTMIYNGATITGKGQILTSDDGTMLGSFIAGELGVNDAAGDQAWDKFGKAFRAHLVTHGQCLPTSMIPTKTVAGGGVTGFGTIGFATTIFSPSLATAIGAGGDPANEAVWANLGSAILAYISTNGIVGKLPQSIFTGFLNPGTPGPITGFSAIK